MNYLKVLVSGEAERAIAGLPMTSVNYAKVINLLKELFG